MPDGMIAIVILGIIVVALFALFAYWREKERREACRRLAAQLGLEYTRRSGQLVERYGFIDALRKGSDRYAFNILSGEYQGHRVQAFDFHYATYSHNPKGGRRKHHHYASFFILRQERSFPELRIYPEGFFSKLGQMIGFDDIDFESLEFSRAFCVRSRDKKFAYDICHPRMMEYLLGHRGLSIEIEGHAIAISFSKRLDLQEVPRRLDQLIEIRALFPDYLYRT